MPRRKSVTKPEPVERGRSGRNLELERQWEREKRVREGERITLRLPPDELAQIDSRAQARETRGVTIRRLLRDKVFSKK
jgi:hypothetical protein